MAPTYAVPGLFIFNLTICDILNYHAVINQGQKELHSYFLQATRY